MNRPMKRLLFWTPRALTLLFALFLSLFALDVFNGGFGPWRTTLALLMHLIPTGIVLVVLALSWRWEWVGAVLFPGLGLYYCLLAWAHPNWILVIAGPLFLLGVLFLFNWLYRRQLRAS